MIDIIGHILAWTILAPVWLFWYYGWFIFAGIFFVVA